MASNKSQIFQSSGLKLRNSSAKKPLEFEVNNVVQNEMNKLTEEFKFNSAKRKISNLINDTRSTPVRQKGEIPLKNLITNHQPQFSSAKKITSVGIQKDLRTSQYSNNRSAASIPRQIQNIPQNNTLQRNQPYVSILGNSIAQLPRNPEVSYQSQQELAQRPPIPTQSSSRVVNQPQRKYSLTRNQATEPHQRKVFGNYNHQSLLQNDPLSRKTNLQPQTRKYNSHRAIPNSTTTTNNISNYGLQNGIRGSGYSKIYPQPETKVKNSNPVTITGDSYHYARDLNSAKVMYNTQNNRKYSGSFNEGKNSLRRSNYDYYPTRIGGNSGLQDYRTQRNYVSFLGAYDASRRSRSRNESENLVKETKKYKSVLDGIKKRNGFEEKELGSEGLGEEIGKENREGLRFKGKVRDFDIESAIDRIISKAFA